MESVKNLAVKLSDARQQIADAHAVYTGVREAVARGEDVLQFADALGERVLAGAMGLDGQASIEAARLSQDLLTMRSDLENSQRRLGPNHPDVRDLQAQIQRKQQFLAQNPITRMQSSEETSRTYLGPKLLEKSAQKLRAAMQQEKELAAKLDSAKAKALQKAAS